MSELTAEQKKELFDNLEKAKAKVIAAQASLNNSLSIIHAHLGPGPFRWQGEDIVIVKARKRPWLTNVAGSISEIRQ